MFLHTLVGLILEFLRAAITNVKTGATAVSAVEQAGALVTPPGIIGTLSALAQNAAPAFGNFSGTVIGAASAATYTAGQIVGGIIARLSPGAAYTDCTDTATNIVNSIPGAVVNQSWPLLIGNLGSGLATISGGTGVTISGTATINSGCVRLFLGTVTGSTAVTLTSMFQFAGNVPTNGL